MTKVIIWIIGVLIMFLWAIIGPIFWFPFLVRMIAMFVGTVLVAFGDEGDMAVAQVGLDRAARFYPNGFSHIWQSISNIAHNRVNKRSTRRPAEDFWQPLGIHIISAVLFWYLSLAALGSILNT